MLWSRACLLGLTGLTAVACTHAISDEQDGDPVDPEIPADLPTDIDPGRVTLHRLNRAEYNNTVRDLLGTALRPADDFPADDHGYGFDNIADVLSLSPAHVELYRGAAETLVAELLAGGPVTARYEAEVSGGATVGAATPTAWHLAMNGEYSMLVPIAAPGRYRVIARAWNGGIGLAQADLAIDGTTKRFVLFSLREDAPDVLTMEVDLAPGTKTLSLGFWNDNHESASGNRRSVYIDAFEITGPLGAPLGPAKQRLLSCDLDAEGAACAHTILASFGLRAWRRPLAADELDRLGALVGVARGQGDSWQTGLGLALQAILLSPHFLFRVELDPRPGEPVRALSSYEVATRLSYFLWSSMPDDALFALAGANAALDGAAVRAEVERMLADPKAGALIDNFAGQWLEIRRLEDVAPSAPLFPQFDAALRAAMQSETRGVVAEFLRGERPLSELLIADFTYLDDRLAAHYGLPAVGGTGPQRVVLAGAQRRGLLTHGGFLTLTSYPTRTSPVQRGRWVLQQLLCAPPPDPPTNVTALADDGSAGGTLRQRLEQHREDPVCASCHQLMDPIGFGLEHYDAIGRYRERDGQAPVDATGELPDGPRFSGAGELAEILARDPRLPRCAAEKMLTYALGRGVESAADHAAIDGITAAYTGAGMTLRALIGEIAASAPFRMRRAETAEEAAR